VVWLAGEDETGDMMTKILPAAAFMKHKKTALNKA